MVAEKYSSEFELAFVNNGNQNNDTIPERLICEVFGITLTEELGGEIQLSCLLQKNNLSSEDR